MKKTKNKDVGRAIGEIGSELGIIRARIALPLSFVQPGAAGSQIILDDDALWGLEQFLRETIDCIDAAERKVDAAIELAKEATTKKALETVKVAA